MGLLIALKNLIDDRIDKAAAAKAAPVEAGSKRVRVTGKSAERTAQLRPSRVVALPFALNSPAQSLHWLGSLLLCHV